MKTEKPQKILLWTVNGPIMVFGLHAQPHATLEHKLEAGKWHKLPETGVKDAVVLHLIPDLATGKDVPYQQHQLLQQPGLYQNRH